MVPVVTYVLGPEDLGLFALVSILPSMLSVAGPMGAGFLLARHYPSLDVPARKQMISSMLFGGAVVLVLVTGIFVAAWRLWLQDLEVFRAIPPWALGIAFATMFLGFPWTIANDVVTLDARAETYAGVTTLQSAASAGATIAGLFVFGWGVTSLFVAAAVGAFVTCLGALKVLRPYCGLCVSGAWVRRIIRVGVPATSATFVENLQTFVERYTLSSYAGMGDLGLLAHSQQYRALIAMVLKAAARSLWPVTLAEARSTSRDFSGTKVGWTLAYLFVIAAGIIFATIGQDLIGLLTHGKFSNAYWMVGLWAIFILIQNSGKPDTGILYAHGEAVAYSRIMTLSYVVGIALTLGLVPFAGVLGIFVALITQQMVFRALVYLRARDHYQGDLREDWVWAGMGLIGGILLASYWMNLELPGRAGMCGALLAVLALAARRYVALIVQQVKKGFQESSGLVGQWMAGRST